MPRSLSRIEREYVLKHMAETLPALSVLCGSSSDIPSGSSRDEASAASRIDVEAGSYRVDRGSIFLKPDGTALSGVTDDLACEVLFSHKRRALSFKSSFRVIGGTVSVAMGDDVYTSDGRDRPPVSCAMKARFPGASLAFGDSPDFPLELDGITPEEAAVSAVALRKVLDRLAIDGTDGYGRVAAHRLREYFDRVKADRDPGQWARTVLLVDGSTLLVTVEDSVLANGAVEAAIPVTLECGVRLVECVCRLSGSVPVSRGIALACLSYVDIKPEDRRFLHERAHRDKYVG